MILCDSVDAGGSDGHVHLWDLRNMNAGLVHEYLAYGPDYGGNMLVCSLAVDPRHNTLISGGSAGLVCWDLQTGMPHGGLAL
jgi:hypothetical protein